MKKNNTIECIIIGIQDYGLFVECGKYEGLVHISEISDQYVDDIYNLFSIGDKMRLAILEKDDENKKLKLSYKKTHPIHSRIRRHVPIIKGFNTLKNTLELWIKTKKGDE